MGQARVARVTAYVAMAMILALLASSRVLAADDHAGLNQQALQLHSQGRYNEAAAAAEKALALADDTLGAEHPHTLIYANNLGLMYKMLGRYAEAETVYRRALDGGERVFGPEHAETLTSVNNLAALYEAQERYAEAEPMYVRALAGREHVLGGEHPNTLRTRNNLAGLYVGQGRYAEAELLYRSTMTAFERVLGADHPDTLTSVNKLAGLHQAQGRYSEAAPLYRRALEARERVLGVNHPNTLTSVNDLAFLFIAQGLYDEAEPLYRRALDVREQVLGADHPDTLVSVNNLAALYASRGRDTEAEPLYRRALDAAERVLGTRHRVTLAAIDNLALLYRKQGRHDDAERLHRRALGIAEQLYGSDHPDMLVSISNLATLHQAQRRYAEAEPLYRHALALAERTIGAEHPKTLTAVNNLAVLYQLQRRYAEAEPLYKRVIEARERMLGPDHPDAVSSLSNLATLYLLQRNWSQAAHYWKRSTAAIVARTQRGTFDVGQAVLGKRKSDAEQASFQFAGLVRVAHRLASAGGAPDAAASRAMFQTAQWALSSEAAQSLAQMAARGTKGDPKLATLVRERQDLVAEWQKREVLRNVWLGQESARRNRQAEAENHGRMAGIDRRLAEIDAKLVAEFPDYASLASPAPLAVDEVQALLGSNEALVLFLDTAEWQTTPGETFIWVVTANDVRWVRSDLGSETLSREVQALRCGLDAAAWAKTRCAEFTGRSHPVGPLPFDHARAHAVYKALFGQVEDLIRDKHLLIVPSGALTQLPFQVLVTAPSVNADHKSAAWLIREHALTVLPAVSSLKALRRVGKRSAATKPLIGFGNPLLDGPDSTYAEYARRARDKQSCPKTIWQRVTGFFRIRSGVRPMELRSGLADPSKLRVLAPLPETADELCAVARDLGADVSEIRLGAHATEHEVKTLSRSGELAQYRIAHFATHGAMAGELDGASEPGLIFTPPPHASEDDDGYLSASEIAGLRLDADWVILSACNTAAGAATDAQALSGLARAFIYAQARALLVSHWAVDSNATVKLITAAMREIGRDRTVGRAEALRRAMLAMTDKGTAHEAHPAYWAPFIVVGEGGR
jgi:CHAT domain-containing protein/tetratricopeptide (TPR) repeat protein